VLGNGKWYAKELPAHISKGTHSIYARARIHYMNICKGTQGYAYIYARVCIQICRGTHTIYARARIHYMNICKGTHTLYEYMQGHAYNHTIYARVRKGTRTYMQGYAYKCAGVRIQYMQGYAYII